MKISNFFWSIALFVGIVMIDQLTKQNAVNTGIFVLNTGFMGGSLTTLQSTLRLSLVSALLGSVFVFYLTLILVFGLKSNVARLSVTALVASISSNALDRYLRAGVVDWISLPVGSHSIILNFSDLVQWVAFGSLLTLAFKYWKNSAPEIENRSFFGSIFNPERVLEFKYSFLISTASTLFALLTGAIFFEDGTQDLFPVLICMGLFSFTVLFLVSFLILRRVIGPIFALKRYLELDETNRGGPFILRSGDPFEFLVKLINKS